MPLFQNSVLVKYQKTLNKQSIYDAYLTYKSYFHNTTIQENIRNSKEEQFQEGFLNELFCKILGYTLNPNPDYNLITENKNIKDSKKADGAILIPAKLSTREHAALSSTTPLSVVGIIELKGTDTTDLGKIETQAFGYKNNQPECVYVITSNFEKLRFYIDNAIEYLEFNLFTLSLAEFELLYTCLAYENIKEGLPKKLKDDSIGEENKVTKQLYTDYSLFKKELYQSLVDLNSQFEPLELFKKSQKLLDRFLFLFFAEDRNLLPPNSVRLILNDWKDLQDRDEEIPLYNRFKKYFEYLNTGFKGKRYDVFAYNGGLFKPDEILDHVKINDNLLFKHAFKLSEYDFVSEIDVNILGHIFENSLNELDEVKAQLEGQEVDKTKTKRKKDGVFYTPKYITKYIVDNTIGKLCTEKKAELNIVETEYAQSLTREHAPLPFGNKHAPLPITKKKKQELLATLTEYKNWLLQLTICDPACGSGAFLNQALDFLITEHRYIDELQAKLFGDAMVLSDVEKSILENNLFGVDLNDESVEIAKLSLWLRTAQPNRKLNDLNNNIKCGNSLIDDPTIAGDKAFNWQTAFPQVFEKKEKTPYHITTAIHDSRTSDRMITYNVREKRANGAIPEPQVIWLSEEDEILITKTVVEIIEQDNLNVLAYNICRDHMHLLLVCEEQERDRIVQKIKAKTARAVNIMRGVTVPTSTETIPTSTVTIPTSTVTREHAPLSITDEHASDSSITREHAPHISATREHAPLSIADEHAPLSIEKEEKTRGEKQNSLWTQKYGCKKIEDDQQLNNTIEYIRNNRIKHNLPSMKQGSMLPCLYQSSEHAFRTEYKGGFDVVIGNPPYVRQELFKEIKPFLELNYKCYNSIADLYTYFIEKGIFLMNDKGIFSFILPNKFIKANYGKEIRKVISEKVQVELIFDFDDYPVFEDATTYPLIFIFSKEIDKSKTNFIYSEINKRDLTNDPINLLIQKSVQTNSTSINGDVWALQNIESDKLTTKMKDNSISLIEVVNDRIYRGVSTGKNEVFIINGDIAKDLLNDKNKIYIREIVTGKEVKRYNLNFDNLYLLFIPWDYDLDYDESIKKYLLSFKEVLSNRPEVKEGRFNWWCLSRYGSKNSEYLFKPKIIYPRINNECNFYFDSEGTFSLSDNNFFISTDEKYLIPILNSKLIYYYLKSIASTLQGGYLDFRRPYMENIPIKTPINKHLFVEISDKMHQTNKDLQELSQKFQRTIIRKFFPNAESTREHAPLPQSNSNNAPLSIVGENVVELPKKLQDWYLLTYAEFIKELAKKKIKLSLAQEAEWEEYFTQEAKKALAFKQQIDTTDKEIDQMVYKLYELTEEEIKIVEGV